MNKLQLGVVFGSRSCNFNGMTGVLCFYNRVIKKRTIYALVNPFQYGLFPLCS